MFFVSLSKKKVPVKIMHNYHHGLKAQTFGGGYGYTQAYKRF